VIYNRWWEHSLELAIRVGAHFILNKWLPGFSNISYPENPRFWMYQNIKRIDRFRKRTGGYLTNSNSPTAKVQRIRDRLLKPVASTLIIIYEVDSHISNPWFHAQPTHVVQGRATKHSVGWYTSKISTLCISRWVQHFCTATQFRPS
jgi:hypothetical protein